MTRFVKKLSCYDISYNEWKRRLDTLCDEAGIPKFNSLDAMQTYADEQTPAQAIRYIEHWGRSA